ncbi:hypothetical protein G4B88_015462 [Cannabis sativa]|uniref:Agglutinin domain-containing protein n=1 Tax=Cannabis sativa TaxID=3483 RepID=A0A7J6DIW9_CANSA|nr:hypothetical protein G4B88_015462 [Cannabis sativa]
MAAPAVVFPRFVVIKSKFNSKYLRKITKEEIAKTTLEDAFLFVKEDKITSPLAKFELIIAKTNPGCVHIRCCYNNKYLTRIGGHFIEAKADQPIEDAKRLSCTMFEITEADLEGYFRIRHKQSDCYVVLSRSEGERHDRTIVAESTTVDRDHCDMFQMLDWESFVIFPEIVSFSHEKDTNYLSYNKDNSCLQFVENKDIADLTVGNEMYIWGDGYVRIKNVSSNKYWRRRESDNWILADSDDATGNDKNTLFLPIQLGNPLNTVALRNLGNNMFCKRESEYLRAQERSITTETMLLVSESVISRSIEDIIFHIDDVRVHQQIKVGDMVYVGAENPDDEDDNMDIKISYEKFTSATFATSHTLKFGAKTTIQYKPIPFVAEGKITLSSELSNKVKWDNTEKSNVKYEAEIHVNVPHKSRVTYSVPVKWGTCDVPYSYTRVEKLYNGESKLPIPAMIATVEDNF